MNKWINVIYSYWILMAHFFSLWLPSLLNHFTFLSFLPSYGYVLNKASLAFSLFLLVWSSCFQSSFPPVILQVSPPFSFHRWLQSLLCSQSCSGFSLFIWRRDTIGFSSTLRCSIFSIFFLILMIPSFKIYSFPFTSCPWQPAFLTMKLQEWNI